MRRLHALGTAFLFLGTLGLAAQASADPINIESGAYIQSAGKPGPLKFSGNGFSYADVRGVEASGVHAEGHGDFTFSRSFDDDFPLSARSAVRGLSYNNLRLDSRFSVTSPGFAPSAFSNKVPVQFTGNLTGNLTGKAAAYGYSSEAGRSEQVFSQQLPGSGTAQVAFAQSGGKMVPTAVSYTFGGASSVVTPEPASMLLLGSGLGLAALRARIRRRRR